MKISFKNMQNMKKVQLYQYCKNNNIAYFKSWNKDRIIKAIRDSEEHNTNKSIIIELLNKEGLTLGCYHNEIDKLSSKEFQKVLSNFFYDSTDIKVNINRKPYVIEVCKVDNEIDFLIKSLAEYKNLYGVN